MAQRTCVSYKLLVGLEIHVQLCTSSKMFTGVVNASGNLRPDDPPPLPNSAVDPVVLGLPGVLPVINRRAVEFAIRVGLAMNCQIASFTKWDRKSYYYPDLPKNYQISQYDLPLCGPGHFELPLPDGSTQTVRIRRAHLEEDAGKLLHEAPGGYPIDWSIVDLNRAGTPLLEIVTEPDLTTPEQVRLFAQELQKLVQFLGVSHGQMQLGHMRFEPNINVHITDRHGAVHKTAITEIKNLNSFNVLEKATAYELRRQIAHWEKTGELGRKSTYGWDDVQQVTVHQRDKEEAHDYRYFPDPDLMPVIVDERWLAEIRGSIGELPAARRRRYLESLKLSDQEATLLASDKSAGDLFDRVVKAGIDAKRAAALMESLRELVNDRRTTFGRLGIDPALVAGVGQLVTDGTIGASKEITKQIFAAALEQPEQSARQIAERLGLVQSTDTAPIDAAIDALIAENPKGLQDYRAGKQTAMGSLIGAIMKSQKGLNPKLVAERLKSRLG